MEDATWVDREASDRTRESYDDRENGRLTVRLSTEERALLEEAMALTKTSDVQEVVRVALKELVERQRFLNWVAAHEREGTA